MLCCDFVVVVVVVVSVGRLCARPYSQGVQAEVVVVSDG